MYLCKEVRWREQVPQLLLPLLQMQWLQKLRPHLCTTELDSHLQTGPEVVHRTRIGEGWTILQAASGLRY